MEHKIHSDFHILLIPSWYFDMESEGIFIHEHARMTASLGYKTGLIYVRQNRFIKGKKLEFSNRDGFEQGILEDYTLPKLPFLILMWKKKYLSIFREYCARYGVPNLIHAHGYIAGIAARYISRRAQIQYLITEHSTAIPEHSVPWYHHKELKLAYRESVKLIAVSDFLRRAMLEYTKHGRQITVISNPVDFAKFSATKRNSASGKVSLISIGSLERRKNYSLLLEAFSYLCKEKDVQLVIIGTGQEENHLQELSVKLGIKSRLTFAGHLSTQEVRAMLSQSDVFVSSSIMENFGVAIAEALACGLPVVATESGGPQEYMTELTGRVVQHDSRSLAKAVKDVIENLSGYDPIEIRSFSKSRFDFAVVGLQVSAIYSELLSVT